jgi:hypothetical protein
VHTRLQSTVVSVVLSAAVLMGLALSAGLDWWGP